MIVMGEESPCSAGGHMTSIYITSLRLPVELSLFYFNTLIQLYGIDMLYLYHGSDLNLAGSEKRRVDLSTRSPIENNGRLLFNYVRTPCERL